MPEVFMYYSDNSSESTYRDVALKLLNYVIKSVI